MADDIGVEYIAAFQPRDVTLAKRLITALTVVAAAVTIAVSLLGLAPDPGRWAAVAIVGPALVVVAAVAIRVMSDPPAWLWAAYPIGAVVMIALTDLATRDATVTAQIFFFFPVLYAGAQLRRTGGMILTAVASLAEIVVTFAALPSRLALVDSVYVVAALVTAAALLIHTGERADRLVTRLTEQAAIDPLTSLVTRRVLDSAAMSALKSAAGDGGTALLLVDLDHFKTVNDVHGHLAGDLVLQQVSAVLKDVGRRTDVVSRMGGDEFAILMSGCPLHSAIDRAQSVVSRIRDLRIDLGAVTIARPSDGPGVVSITASVGLAHLPTHASELHELYRSADISLYRAKRAGRDQVAELDLDPV